MMFIVIGCGITGAATAFELSRYQLKVGHSWNGSQRCSPCGTTKANSAILHAGL